MNKDYRFSFWVWCKIKVWPWKAVINVFKIWPKARQRFKLPASKNTLRSRSFKLAVTFLYSSVVELLHCANMYSDFALVKTTLETNSLSIIDILSIMIWDVWGLGRKEIISVSISANGGLSAIHSFSRSTNCFITLLGLICFNSISIRPVGTNIRLLWPNSRKFP